MAVQTHRPDIQPRPVSLVGSKGSSEHRSDSSDIKLSFEFFPPKTAAMEKTLWRTIHALQGLGPDFVSVTYGAGGTTQARTHDTVTRIIRETGLSAAAHLTCVGATRQDIDAVARKFWDAGIRHIVALRGDPPGGVDGIYQPHTGGYAYASDLVAGLMQIADFDISVSAYPERHPESADWRAEIDNLRRKVDAGARRAITQFFFTSECFLRFRDRARDAGITIPIIPGIMLQPNFAGLKRMSDMCGVTVPSDYSRLFDGLDDRPDVRAQLTAYAACDLMADLREGGVNQFHLYTLNRADIARSVIRILGLEPQQRLSA